MTTIGVFANIFDNQGRILCVKRAYGPKNWTTPGGRMEMGEHPEQALIREVLEETGYHVRAVRLVGIYSKPEKDDLVISIEAEIVGNDGWQPGNEIAEQGFFDPNELPEPMRSSTLTRIMDGVEKRSGIMRVFVDG